jgi:hypothetical protein
MAQPKHRIENAIDEFEAKMDETLAGLQSGPVRDSFRLIIPMFKDHNQLLRDILDRTA